MSTRRDTHLSPEKTPSEERKDVREVVVDEVVDVSIDVNDEDYHPDSGREDTWGDMEWEVTIEVEGLDAYRLMEFLQRGDMDD